MFKCFFYPLFCLFSKAVWDRKLMCVSLYVCLLKCYKIITITIWLNTTVFSSTTIFWTFFFAFFSYFLLAFCRVTFYKRKTIEGTVKHIYAFWFFVLSNHGTVMALKWLLFNQPSCWLVFTNFCSSNGSKEKKDDNRKKVKKNILKTTKMYRTLKLFTVEILKYCYCT